MAKKRAAESSRENLHFSSSHKEFAQTLLGLDDSQQLRLDDSPAQADFVIQLDASVTYVAWCCGQELWKKNTFADRVGALIVGAETVTAKSSSVYTLIVRTTKQAGINVFSDRQVY